MVMPLPVPVAHAVSAPTTAMFHCRAAPGSLAARAGTTPTTMPSPRATRSRGARPIPRYVHRRGRNFLRALDPAEHGDHLAVDGDVLGVELHGGQPLVGGQEHDLVALARERLDG